MTSRAALLLWMTTVAYAGMAGAQPADRSSTARPADAVAQAYPTRPIRFIVPYPPGGGTDIVARVLGQKLSERFGQQVVIDNRGGANAIIGTALAAKAAPDGYTLLIALPANLAVNPSLYRDLPYDPIRDFAPVIHLNSVVLLLAAHPSLPANSVKELIQLAKEQPGKLAFASSGTGGSSHLAMELFKMMAKVDMVHVPYKGGGPAINDLLGGQVQLYSGTMITLAPHVSSGRLKALAVSTARRHPNLPGVPAIAETLPGYEFVAWQGLLVPRATPNAIVKRLNREVAEILKAPDVRERFAAQGADPIGGTPAEFGALIKADTAKYARLIKQAGIRAE